MAMDLAECMNLNGAETRKSEPLSGKSICPPTCPKCNEKFAFRYQLEWHYKWKHGLNGDPLLLCTQCNLTFECALKFALHMSQSDHRELPHSCEKCDLKFGSDLELRMHHLVHRKSLSGLSCGKCGKTFADRLSLQRHSELHTEAPPQPANCSGCFSRMSFRQKHGKTRVVNCPHEACTNERICARGFYRTL